MAIYDVNGTELSGDTLVLFERGGIESNGALGNETANTVKRSPMMNRCNGGGTLMVSFKTSATISSASVFFYRESGAYMRTSALDITDSGAVFVIPEGASFYKIVVNLDRDAEIAAFLPEDEVCNPYIISQTIGSSAAFVYAVSSTAATSGRLILPPNYSLDGERVPLVVFVHGSEGMMSWDSIIGYAGDDADYRPYLNYLANEGFAVFDCYPWTDKETIDSAVFSPCAVASNILSYVEGIRYVCSRFNVDINKVNLLCKSQGGHIGHWAYAQTLFPFKTVSLFAPSTGIGWNKMFFNANMRRAITKYTEFNGTQSEINTFISDGQYSTATVKSFCDKNKPQLVNLMPFAHGVTNSTMEDLYAANFEVLSDTPQWMLDEGLPEKPSGALSITGPAAHPEFVITGQCPVKFWCAFDDAATSSYVNYAICYWLQNGASDAIFRTLPLNTGGHHAMDTDSAALKKSGTTALGISYTNIPLAYTEVVDFIRLKLGD